MKRKVTLLVAAMTLALVLAGGVALAATVVCTANPCVGTSANDQIFGDFPSETINALAGSDYVDGFPGNDTILGGDNADVNTFTPAGGTTTKGLIGAEDSDTVFGQGGSDYIDLATFDSTGSVDRASGGRGNDTIDAFDGNQDIISCGKGTRDHVYFDKGIDTVSRNCEKKHPNVAPASAASAAASDGERPERPERPAEE